ncbi:ankyrin repeat domain-containing protein [Candidatus Dependentiae bacterium]|nr:ankyrin repeat domain-containing protein [Candidatus Dependentiae bacterium]
MKKYFFTLSSLLCSLSLAMHDQSTTQDQLNKQLLATCSIGLIEEARDLLQKGAQVNTQSPLNGYTPLHYALCAQSPQLVNMLLENGANINLRNTDNKSSLENALDLNQPELYATLDTYPNTLKDTINNPTEDTFLTAVHFGWSNIVEYLLKNNSIILPHEHVAQYIQYAKIRYNKTGHKEYQIIEENLLEYTLSHYESASAIKTNTQKLALQLKKLKRSIKNNAIKKRNSKARQSIH